jgi:hypothetical protein
MRKRSRAINASRHFPPQLKFTPDYPATLYDPLFPNPSNLTQKAPNERQKLLAVGMQSARKEQVFLQIQPRVIWLQNAHP